MRRWWIISRPDKTGDSLTDIIIDMIKIIIR